MSYSVISHYVYLHNYIHLVSPRTFHTRLWFAKGSCLSTKLQSAFSAAVLPPCFINAFPVIVHCGLELFLKYVTLHIT